MTQVLVLNHNRLTMLCRRSVYPRTQSLPWALMRQLNADSVHIPAPLFLRQPYCAWSFTIKLLSGLEEGKSSTTRGVVMTSMFGSPLNSAMRNHCQIADALLAHHASWLVLIERQSPKFNRNMFAKFLCGQWHHSSKRQQGVVWSSIDWIPNAFEYWETYFHQPIYIDLFSSANHRIGGYARWLFIYWVSYPQSLCFYVENSSEYRILVIHVRLETLESNSVSVESHDSRSTSMALFLVLL